MSKRAPLTLMIVLQSLLFLPAIASAHQLVVIDGPGVIDAGTGEPARLIHAMLTKHGDELQVTVRPTAGASEAVLYVPDQRPERAFDNDEIPQLALGPSTITTNVGERVVDDATNVAYREIGRVALPAKGGAATIAVRRGSVPSRVALRVGPPTPFAADDVDATPRALQQVVSWANNPPAGSVAAKAKASDAARSRHRFAWGGALIALIAVGSVVWWLVRGWHAARRRGVERAVSEQRD